MVDGRRLPRRRCVSLVEVLAVDVLLPALARAIPRLVCARSAPACGLWWRKKAVVARGGATEACGG